MTQPKRFTKVGEFRTLGPVDRVSVVGQSTYVKSGWNSNLHWVELINVANLHQGGVHITEVEHYQTPDTAQQLTVVAEQIYIADWLGGLLILEFMPPD